MGDIQESSTVSINVTSYPDENYELSGLMDINNDVYALMLTCKIDNILKFNWDNDTYLTDELYPLISLWVNDKEIGDSKEFGGVVEFIPITDFELILEMFNRAKSLGLFI